MFRKLVVSTVENPTVRKLVLVIIPPLLVLAAAARKQQPNPLLPTQAAPLIAAWITVLVVLAMFFQRDPTDTELAAQLPQASDPQGAPAQGTAPTLEPWKTFYDRATQMHIDTDKGMYQLITVFVGASLLVLSWVVGRSTTPAPTKDDVALIGSLAVTLVGVATLLKHRLRHYNKLREIYLRRLESRFCAGADSKSGPHTFISTVMPRGLSLSFHEAIDAYYFIHLALWLLLYWSKP